MKLLLSVSCLLILSLVPTASAGVLEGWTVERGQAGTGTVLVAQGTTTLNVKTSVPRDLPVDMTIRFRVSIGDALTIDALEETPNAKPLLRALLRLTGPDQLTVVAQSSGEAMGTEICSIRAWNTAGKKIGSLLYKWRFPKVKNLWDDRDRREIGAAYAGLMPFEEKVFTLRMALTTKSRQIWLDDRLVAEERVPTPAQARFGMQLQKSARVLSVEFGVPAGNDRFLPLALDDYSHARRAQETKANSAIDTLHNVPMFVPKTAYPDIDLGDSLFRYRLTHGSGPDAGYVNGKAAWPGTFEIDPAQLTFRVPYRNYQNAWLLAWVEDKPNTVARGALRFFRDDAGHPASSDFEISARAIQQGLVTKLSQKAVNGRQLYLVRVPLNTDGLYGMTDMADQFLEFELTKPLALQRSYPDPIYYGYHPAGLPSSIHVVGITLEEAPFGFAVQPKEFGFVFEQPERPGYTIVITNTTGKPLDAKVTLQSKSFDGEEKEAVTGAAKIDPGSTGQVELSFDLKKLGWHELKTTVEADGVQRECSLSMVLLPPNTRTYGTAPNETRFGLWNLLGHYTPLKPGAFEANEKVLAMLRKLGMRRIDYHRAFIQPEMAKKYDFLEKGPHTIINVVYRWKEDDLEGQKKMIDVELEAVGEMMKYFAEPSWFYGGEWHIGRMVQYAPWPLYTGEGDRALNEEERKNAEHQVRIFTAIGKALKQKYPKAKLFCQWGAPQGTMAYLRSGLPKDIVDGFGMDAPMFELLPEISNVTGSINGLWELREEAKRAGWPRLPIRWCEGPFFPTNPGALTLRDQMEYQVRYLLLGLAYGVDQFEAGVVPFDAGNYYGAEHYGAGVFHRIPLVTPKPAVAAIATMTSMLCGADPIGGVDTGSLTTYCMAFQRAKDQAKLFALWRVRGTVEARLRVRGTEATVTDAMGNATKVPVRDGAITVEIGASPVWLTGVEQIDGFEFGAPKYDSAPSQITRPLAAMTADRWTFDHSEDKLYANNHFAIRRLPDEKLAAEFGTGEPGYEDAVTITLPVEPGDRPLLTRYATLRLKKPVAIPGRASALGLWIQGNSSWGRVVYQLRDANGETWTSVGTKDDWNCDDTHAWSYVNFEGWRYVRFPLPGNHPYDSARDLEFTWWGSHGGDGIVDLPLTLEKIFVEARNEVPYLGEIKVVPARSFKLSKLVAEYDSEEDTTPVILAKNRIRRPTPDWSGPSENPIAKLAAEGSDTAPVIHKFTEPTHFNDGRRMVIHFPEAAGTTYNLYLSLYPDGRGADLLKAGVKNEDNVVGFKPGTKMYLFLTSTGADKKESKPSKPFELVTHDNFAEK